jgi:hypothetical protein
MPQHPPERAVYTALIGGYERLQEQPVAEASDLPFICFTDDPTLTSTTWEVRLVEPAFARDATRSSRFAKIMGHQLLPEYDETLWIDNRIVLSEAPEKILDDLLGDADLAVIHHSYRDTVMAEFDEVARAGLDEPARVYEQLIHYAETRPHVLDVKPYWGAFIARRWTPEVREAMQTWLHHVLRYSRRDQLSMRFALDGVPRVRALDLDNFRSPWHTWITDNEVIERDHSMRVNAFRTSIRAPLATLTAAQAEAAALRAELAVQQERTRVAEEKVVDLRTRVVQLRDRVGRLRKRVERLDRRLTAERSSSAGLRAQLARSPRRRLVGAVRRVAGNRRA